MIAGGGEPRGPARQARSPADPERVLGEVHDATPEELAAALDAAGGGSEAWSRVPVAERAAVLRRAADLYEEN